MSTKKKSHPLFVSEVLQARPHAESLTMLLQNFEARQSTSEPFALGQVRPLDA